MFALWTGLFLALVLAWVRWDSDGDLFYTRWARLFWQTVLIGVSIAVFTLLISFVIYSPHCGERRLDQTQSVVALNDTSSVYGSFFLGIGTIQGTMVYVYYTDEGNGIYQFHSADAHRCEVHEVEGIAPRVETWGPHYKSPGCDYLFFQSVMSERYRFYIPPGSVQQNIGIDLR